MRRDRSMSSYHLKVVKGRTVKMHPCEMPTITVVPSQGHYAENPHLIDMPKGQKIKFDLEFVNTKGEMERKIILLPKDGSVAYLLDDKGNTIDTYPKKRDRQVEIKPEQEFGLKVGRE
jgi:hypothetical protein